MNALTIPNDTMLGLLLLLGIICALLFIFGRRWR